MEATKDGVSIQDRISNHLFGQPAEAASEEIEPVQDVDITADDLEETEIESLDVQEDEEPLDLEFIAQSIGLSADQLEIAEDGLKVKTKIDGEEGKAKFTDLLKSYQLEGHLNKKDTALAEKIKEAEQRRVDLEAQAQQKLTALDDSLRMAYGMLQHEASQVDWKDLEQNDPDEYVKLRLKYQDRDNQIKQAFAQVQQERQRQAQEAEMKRQQRIQENATKLHELIPEWANDDRERQEVINYAMSNGYSVEDVNNIDDWRTVNLLRKAMLFDNLKSKAPEVKEKVKKAPKYAKPGQSTQKIDKEAAALKDSRNRIRKTGGKSGTVADYLLKKGIV